MTDPARSWLTLDKAATATGRSRRTIERWVADKRLDTVTVLGRTHVNELQALQVERDTRHAPARGRPGPRGASLVILTTRVVPSQEGGPRPPQPR